LAIGGYKALPALYRMVHGRAPKKDAAPPTDIRAAAGLPLTPPRTLARGLSRSAPQSRPHCQRLAHSANDNIGLTNIRNASQPRRVWQLQKLFSGTMWPLAVGSPFADKWRKCAAAAG